MLLGFIGTTELLLIGGIALLLFGGKKLPEMMRGLGKGVREFKEGMNDITSSDNVENNQPNSDADANTEPSTSESDINGIK